MHLAYPFMGVAFLVVPVMGWWLPGEPLHAQTFVGGARMLAGIAMAARAQ